MTGKILVIILLPCLLVISSAMNIFNNDEDYLDDVWLDNEYKAKLHNRLYNNKEYSLDSFEDNDKDNTNVNDYYYDGLESEQFLDDIRDIGSRNLPHTCREVATGPYRLEHAGYDIRPPHYHNITCIEFTGNPLQHGPMILQCEAKRLGHRQKCATAIRQINVFRKLKSSKDSCWKQDTMWIENGCNCKS